MIFAQLNAQNISYAPCGNSISNKVNHLDKHQQQLFKEHQQLFLSAKTAKSNRLKIPTQIVPVKPHVVRNSNGHGGVSSADLERALVDLNAIFKDVKVEFHIFDGIDYIDNDDLNALRKGKEGELINNYTEGALNIYITDKLINNSGSSICGYNLDNIDKSIIIMKNSCATNGSSLAHEIGHFFSLLHTHGRDHARESELVDGSNCDTTGDGICDTPADPGLSFDNIDSQCNYIGEEQDANGDFYEPDTGNVMSYSRKSCRTHFSTGQYARMYGYYVSIKDELFQDVEISTTTTRGLDKIRIYPNPVTGSEINIQRGEFLNETMVFVITNLSGQVLNRGLISNDKVNVNQLPSGSYFLTLSNAESSVTKRFIK